MAGIDVRDMEDLREYIRACPVIDNHAHNLLRVDGLKSEPLIAATSEADGEALEDASTSLAHLRAARQLRRFHNLAPGAPWDEIVKTRNRVLDEDADALLTRCFDGMQTLLIDDRYEDAENVETYDWHSKFTKSPCKRIVRIEEVAADILEEWHDQGNLPDHEDDERWARAWKSFLESFDAAMEADIADPEVVGFKSVICYLTGLDVVCEAEDEAGLSAFKQFLPECVDNEFEIKSKAMNDTLVMHACKAIAVGVDKHGSAKPFQFHTGLGSNNMSLLRSNPAYLQPLIDSFPTVPIVLLHSSYPFTREGGYLASVYKNCYLDIGLVWPEISRDGQEQVVRQALELTPWSKIVWSTDGHHHPETFWLSSVQGREAMAKVISGYVEHEDLTLPEAVQAVTDIFFENSNKLYSLNLGFEA